MSKHCYKCGEVKEQSLFSKDRSRKDGLDHACKQCRCDWHKSKEKLKTCPRCLKQFLASRNKKYSCCHDCTRLKCSLSGLRNPNWKGGFRYWKKGRFGKDKNGLSWKVQRRLCWDRDGYKCVSCGKRKNRNPDCHHKIPFRISKSHALNNLVSLCQKCHGIEESKIRR